MVKGVRWFGGQGSRNWAARDCFYWQMREDGKCVKSGVKSGVKNPVKKGVRNREAGCQR